MPLYCFSGITKSGRVWRKVLESDARSVSHVHCVTDYRSNTNSLSHLHLKIVCLVLGDSGGVVNSLDFCLPSLKSHGCFYFRCVLSSQGRQSQ